MGAEERQEGRKMAHMQAQMQIRNNAKDLQEIWQDLGEWEQEMKAKDRKLLEGDEADDSKGFYDLLNEDGELLTDVNSEVMQEAELKEHATKVSTRFLEENKEVLAAKEAAAKEQRIKPKTYQEYNKWDAFDVDEQLKQFDAKERAEKQEAEKAKALAARKKEAEKRRRKKDKKEEALELKEEGNAAFKK